MRLGPPGTVARLPSFFRCFSGSVVWRISLERPRGGGGGDGEPILGTPPYTRDGWDLVQLTSVMSGGISLPNFSHRCVSWQCHSAFACVLLFVNSLIYFLPPGPLHLVNLSQLIHAARGPSPMLLSAVLLPVGAVGAPYPCPLLDRGPWRTWAALCSFLCSLCPV